MLTHSHLWVKSGATTVPSTVWLLTATKCSQHQSESQWNSLGSFGLWAGFVQWVTVCCVPFSISDRTVKIWEAKGSLEEGVYWYLPSWTWPQGPSSYSRTFFLLDFHQVNIWGTCTPSPESEGLVCEEHKGISYFPAECQNHWTASSCLNHVNCCYFFFYIPILDSVLENTDACYAHTGPLKKKKQVCRLRDPKRDVEVFYPPAITVSVSCAFPISCLYCTSDQISNNILLPNSPQRDL